MEQLNVFATNGDHMHAFIPTEGLTGKRLNALIKSIKREVAMTYHGGGEVVYTVPAEKVTPLLSEDFLKGSTKLDYCTLPYLYDTEKIYIKYGQKPIDLRKRGDK